MMKPLILNLVIVSNLYAAVDIREKTTISQDDTTTLYQVGEDGEYCVSLTPDTSGCVSGIDDNGQTVNLLDFVKGKYVVFQNLSDAPHDMKFTGQNQEELPVQDPGAAPSEKKMTVEDLSKQKINCSFHGDMLAVGYRVPGEDEEEMVVGKDEHAAKRVGMDKPDYAPAQPLKPTGLANVANEVLKKAGPAEVEKLVAKKPELMATLAATRPLLAKELQEKGLGVKGPNVGSLQNSPQAGGALIDTGAPKPGGPQVPGKNGTTINDPKKSSATATGFRAEIGAAKTTKELAAQLAGGRNGARGFNNGRGAGAEGGSGSESVADAPADESEMAAAFKSLAGQEYESEARRVAARGLASEGGAMGGEAPEFVDGMGNGTTLDPHVKLAWRLGIGLLGLSIVLLALFMRRKPKKEKA